MYVYTHVEIQLPLSLTFLKFCCDVLSPSQLRDLLNKLSAMIRTIHCTLKFSCTSSGGTDPIKRRAIPLEEYFPIIQELYELKRVQVKEYHTYEQKVVNRKDNASAWSLDVDDGLAVDANEARPIFKFRMNKNGFNCMSMILQFEVQQLSKSQINRCPADFHASVRLDTSEPSAVR
ncbi:hypothetical protein DPMN_062716 [Dreissena polymorpha]|uniref:Uncharacterized protein n=1 Tax=Dreissena polymorpha TaxID=45954 RepID=A0A9D4C967_DREPO|nr:hypothetical protein DPMN_062716 [Dreissena polymorpha]